MAGFPRSIITKSYSLLWSKIAALFLSKTFLKRLNTSPCDWKGTESGRGSFNRGICHSTQRHLSLFMILQLLPANFTSFLAFPAVLTTSHTDAKKLSAEMMFSSKVRLVKVQEDVISSCIVRSHGILQKTDPSSSV